MLDTLWSEWCAWWPTLSPAYVFLLTVPVVVVAVALVDDAARRRPRRERGERRGLSRVSRRTG